MLQGKTPEETRVVTTELVLPSLIGYLEGVMGKTIKAAKFKK
jgi:hypothetical protein